MSGIKHVIRPAPSWSTCPPITICGNVAVDEDLSVEDMDLHIKKDCSGSKNVAYATSCVSCLQQMHQCYGFSYPINEEALVLEQYITKYGRNSKARKSRIAVELEIINKILKETDLESLVDSELERKQWRAKADLKKSKS